jgi:catechol 2,3-dioxygenase-like lactoylglutathione lyase family enzyme
MTDGPVIVGLDHIQLAIPQGGEAKARAFYGDLLGMRERVKPPGLAGRGGAWFNAGSVELHLGVEPEFRPARKAHPALVVSSIEALARVLTEAGHPVQWDTTIPDKPRFHTHDPFGNRLEFIAQSE